MADRLIIVAALSVGLALSRPLPVFAQSALPDPTRPPPGALVEPERAGKSAEGNDDADAAPAVSSIVIPKTGRPRAIIDGKLMGVGDSIGDSRIARISETGVLLRGPNGSQTLRMTPGVEKTMISNAQPKSRSRVEKP